MEILRRILRLPAAALGLAASGWLAFGAQPAAPDFFNLADPTGNGSITRDGMRAAVGGWLGGGARLTQSGLAAALERSLPERVFMGMISPPPSQTPKPDDVAKMMAALPDAAPAKPAKPRKVLVLCKCAGFIHSCIPLAAKTIESLGGKTGAWTTTVSYDSAVITAANLRQYDLVFLNNTTGLFLDDPDAAVTARRKKALLDFVRSGKGLAGIHAASDSYHYAEGGSEFIRTMTPGIFKAADRNADGAVDAAELTALADKWFDALDTSHTGKLATPDFKRGFAGVLFGFMGRGVGTAAAAAKTGPDPQTAAWPDFNRMIGGFFKYHWLYPQPITYKIDDPASPLTAMFREGFAIGDETYTFGMRSWSRNNVHVLTSIDYSKMSDLDKAKEDFPRNDRDYGLSWIRREGKGRVFYAAHGHGEAIYANRKMLEHLLAGIQYALGDLRADDSPSAKK